MRRHRSTYFKIWTTFVWRSWIPTLDTDVQVHFCPLVLNGSLQTLFQVMSTVVRAKYTEIINKNCEFVMHSAVSQQTESWLRCSSRLHVYYFSKIFVKKIINVLSKPNGTTLQEIFCDSNGFIIMFASSAKTVTVQWNRIVCIRAAWLINCFMENNIIAIVRYWATNSW